MNITDLQYAIPTDPKCVAGYVLALIILLIGVGKIVAQARRTARLRNEVSRKQSDAAHLQAMARTHAKMHENDGRGF